ncbi:MAG: 16S rRNA (guanine(966)-N(2))-methyltransferase RsmD [Micrococcales bacterium]|nr:16S rRNA (guanine(966)-N(2))-methyltransferase RsmD [Micrococcales bacterium]
MTRIIAGAAKGRVLKVPGRGTRPTSDRVREALFSQLESLLGGLAGLAVLDLYAGSGALGLEAISRGASQAVLVDSGKAALAAASVNTELVQQHLSTAKVRLLRAKVEKLLAPGWQDQSFDLVFLDPPYELSSQALDQVLGALAQGHWLVDGATIVVERSNRAAGPVWPEGWEHLDSRVIGETALHLARAA